MSNPASRLLTLILLLQRQPNQKAANLASELGISVRSLHRYLDQLDELGIPIYSERGPNGGYSLVRGYKMPPLIFTPDEAVAVCLGTGLVTEMWGDLYREAACSAEVKILNVLGDEQRSQAAWARRSLIAFGMTRVNAAEASPILDQVRQAMRKQRRVQLFYQGANQASPTAREVDPYALVFRWGWWYLAGFCHLRAAIRLFRVDRIQQLTNGTEQFQVPPDFDIQAFLEQELHSQDLVAVQLKFFPQAAAVARQNRSLWDEMDEQPDGSVVVSMHSPDLDWAAGSVLAYGPIVEVLAPTELRRRIVEWTQEIASHYLENQTQGEQYDHIGSKKRV